MKDFATGAKETAQEAGQAPMRTVNLFSGGNLPVSQEASQPSRPAFQQLFEQALRKDEAKPAGQQNPKEAFAKVFGLAKIQEQKVEDAYSQPCSQTTAEPPLADCEPPEAAGGQKGLTTKLFQGKVKKLRVGQAGPHLLGSLAVERPDAGYPLFVYRNELKQVLFQGLLVLQFLNLEKAAGEGQCKFSCAEFVAGQPKRRPVFV